jgi:cold shock CspA family protein
MLIQPADGSPGIFVDKFRVEAVTPAKITAVTTGYVVALQSGARVAVSAEHGERLLAELAGK